MNRAYVYLVVALLLSGCASVNSRTNPEARMEPGIFPGVRADMIMLAGALKEDHPPESYSPAGPFIDGAEMICI